MALVLLLSVSVLSALTSTARATPQLSWSTALTIDSGKALSSISCPTTSLCVAVDEAGAKLTTSDPMSKTSAWQTPVEIDEGQALTAVSCTQEALCVAVDQAGNALASTDPTAAAANWKLSDIDPGNQLSAVSCPNSSLCVAVDDTGRVIASADPQASAPTWSETEIDSSGSLTAVSCASSELCVSVDDQGQALATDQASAPLPSWTQSNADPSAKVTSVSCLANGLCDAVDSSGRVLEGLAPSPAASTGTAGVLSASSATVSGTIDPSGTTLSDCRFEYGSSTSYVLSVPCAANPLSNGGPQTVTATLSGLAAASVYHYRVVATNAAGSGVGADATFTTAQVVSLVHPSASIVGVPSVGERLRCLSGVSSSSPATLSYVWIRDAQAISGAVSSIYQVKAADAKHHLQCRVTATDAAGSVTASSAFVAVPAQGVLAAVGETKVGALTVKAGTVSVPLSCSSRAPAGCAITLRLWSTHTDHLTHRATVTVSSTKVHLNQGQRRTILLSLNHDGRLLLKHYHRLSLRLSVTGTVIGALKATLKSATVTMSSPGRAR